jgi:hypothetical protein
MYGLVYTGIDDYYYDNESQQKVINKCKILKSKIINLRNHPLTGYKDNDINFGKKYILAEWQRLSNLFYYKFQQYLLGINGKLFVLWDQGL